ncbi:MAG TPA: hypothetical protein VMV69_07650 [Pirellulales bacterium]|nr:hypothetical protein [Pirellulales bacterium]
MDLARAYLNDRLLVRDKYSAVALNAVLGLLLLRSHHVAELFDRLAMLHQRWFVELAARRAGWLKDDVEKRCAGDVAATMTRSLANLVQQFQERSN